MRYKTDIAVLYILIITQLQKGNPRQITDFTPIIYTILGVVLSRLLVKYFLDMA